MPEKRFSQEAEIATTQAIGEGLTFEKVWAALMENREQMKETGEQIKENGEKVMIVETKTKPRPLCGGVG